MWLLCKRASGRTGAMIDAHPISIASSLRSLCAVLPSCPRRPCVPETFALKSREDLLGAGRAGRRLRSTETAGRSWRWAGRVSGWNSRPAEFGMPRPRPAPAAAGGRVLTIPARRGVATGAADGGEASESTGGDGEAKLSWHHRPQLNNSELITVCVPSDAHAISPATPIPSLMDGGPGRRDGRGDARRRLVNWTASD